MEQTKINFDEINLTCEEQRVWEIISTVRGKDAAMLGPEIARRTSIPYTEVRSIIAGLINHHGKLIASCGRGYYMAVTPEEIVEATRSLRHRAIMILLRASRLQHASLDEIFGQAKLELGAGVVNGELVAR